MLTLQKELKSILNPEIEKESASEIQLRMIGDAEDILQNSQQEMEGFLKERKFLHSPQTKRADIFNYMYIRSLAHKYALRLLPVSYYHASLPVDLCDKIKEFETIHKGHFEYLILAPKKSFTLLKSMPKTDPILFAMPHSNIWLGKHETSEYYLESGYQSILTQSVQDKEFFYVHSWGNDTTIWNRIKGLFFSFVEKPRFAEKWNLPLS